MRHKVLAAGKEGTREALTRVLAIESRNALARVELAASELSRFEFSPSVGDRITTIHDAVCQIDGLLAKIDLLASPPSESPRTVVDVEAVWRRICERLGPTLRARGIDLEEVKGNNIETGLLVALPEFALEAILCSLLRLVLACVGRNESLRFEVIRRLEVEAVSIGLIATTAGGDWQLDRSGRIELEVQLAEWGGLLDAGPAATQGRLGMLLPAGWLDG